MLYTGMWIPLRRKDQDQRERLRVFSQHEDLTGYQVKFSEFADTVSQMFTELGSLRDTALYPEATRKLVTATYRDSAFTAVEFETSNAKPVSDLRNLGELPEGSSRPWLDGCSNTAP